MIRTDIYRLDEFGAESDLETPPPALVRKENLEDLLNSNRHHCNAA